MKGTMKIKSIITICASVLILGFTSCEDMLRVSAPDKVYDGDYKVDKAIDTVYSVLGVIKQLQKVADRTVLLGELRGDLVAITDHATEDIRDLYKFDYQANKDKMAKNKYNNPLDYYSIINNCNFFLDRADTTLMRNQDSVLLKEYIPMLAYRAWAYLQLGQIYGEVYYVDKPLSSEDQAVAYASGKKLNIKELADTLLKDFKPKFMDYDLPQYGSLGGGTNGDGSKAESHDAKNLFIPIRLIMGDLYLWAERYPEAAICYHDYLTDDYEYIATGLSSILWLGPDFMYLGEDTYSGTFGKDSKPICYIPMESEKYGGIMTDLPNVFNSTKDNDYWYQVTRSNALTSLSARQNYCYHSINEQSMYVSPVYMQDKSVYDGTLLRGDLRLQSILKMKNSDEDQDDPTLNNYRQTLNKINSEKVCLYRNDLVYLRLAEALNRAELPETALMILKTGLCDRVYGEYSTAADKGKVYAISDNEIQRAASKGMSIVYEWNMDMALAYRERVDLNDYTKRTINGHSTPAEYTVYNTQSKYNNTMGIHSRGCGNAAIDTTYKIASTCIDLTDSIRYVEEMILDEMALETCFEGYRFGDLMRISMHRAADAGKEGAGGFADNTFLARRVASRESATMENAFGGLDGTLYNRLKGDGNSLNPNWFLPLPE